MPSPNLPEDVSGAYPAAPGEDASAAPHRTHHSIIHTVINRFEYPTSPDVGDVPLHDGTVYVPTALSSVVGAEVQNYMAGNVSQIIYGGNAAPTTGGAA